MQPATKREAHLKLAAVVDKIGYPDKWIDYGSLTITRESYAANVERANGVRTEAATGVYRHIRWIARNG